MIDHSSMLHAWVLIENSHPQIKEGIHPTQERVLRSLYQLEQLLLPQGTTQKKARSKTSEAFSDSDLSNSADSYSTHRSCCRSAKLNNTTSVLPPITTLAVITDVMTGSGVVGGLWQASWGCTGCTASVDIGVYTEVVVFSFAEQQQLLPVL